LEFLSPSPSFLFVVRTWPFCDHGASVVPALAGIICRIQLSCLLTIDIYSKLNDPEVKHIPEVELYFALSSGLSCGQDLPDQPTPMYCYCATTGKNVVPVLFLFQAFFLAWKENLQCYQPRNRRGAPPKKSELSDTIRTQFPRPEPPTPLPH
jgi:hypothetical protein